MLFHPLLADGSIPAVLGDNQAIFWFRNKDMITHDGSDPGNTANLVLYPAKNAAFFMMTNADASTTEHETAYFQTAQQIQSAVQSFIEAQ